MLCRIDEKSEEAYEQIDKRMSVYDVCCLHHGKWEKTKAKCSCLNEYNDDPDSKTNDDDLFLCLTLHCFDLHMDLAFILRSQKGLVSSGYFNPTKENVNRDITPSGIMTSVTKAIRFNQESVVSFSNKAFVPTHKVQD